MPSSPPPPESAASSEVVYYTVRAPWQWVMDGVVTASTNKKKTPMKQVDTEKDLPSGLLQHNTTVTTASSSTPNVQRRRSVLKKGPSPCTLKLEVGSSSSTKSPELMLALHGTSAALDGLEDKDELVRTMQRCRCDSQKISPPSILIQWNVLREELQNYVPSLPSLTEEHSIAVLKEPMGSAGEGIYFVRDIDETFEQIQRHQQQAEQEPELLDNIMNAKGRMPAWVLQAEVHPPMLIENGKKFHIRSNVAVVEQLWKEELLDIFLHNRHEVRIASQAVEEDDSSQNRDARAHITNYGAAEIQLLENVPELASIQDDLEVFIAKAFQAFMPDIIRRVGYSANQTSNNQQIRKFVTAGIDIMMTSSGRFYLLEVNVNPTARSKEKVNAEIQEHLVGWMTDLVDLCLGRKCRNFCNINDISPLASDEAAATSSKKAFG